MLLALAIYCIIWIIILLISVWTLVWQDKTIFFRNTLNIRKIYKPYFKPYSLKKRIIWYLLFGPFWILWIIFIILY